MIKKEYFLAPEHMGGNDEFAENVFRYRRSAGSNNVKIRVW
jgi:hypothetical protein